MAHTYQVARAWTRDDPEAQLLLNQADQEDRRAYEARLAAEYEPIRKVEPSSYPKRKPLQIDPEQFGRTAGQCTTALNVARWLLEISSPRELTPKR